MARSDNSQPTQQQFAHQRLRVYESAAGFVKLAHQLANGLPTGNAALSDQLRRASISVCLNIAEGAGEYRDGLAEHLVDHSFRLKSVHQAILGLIS